MVKKTTTTVEEEYKSDEYEKTKKRLLPLLRDAFRTDHCKINATS